MVFPSILLLQSFSHNIPLVYCIQVGWVITTQTISTMSLDLATADNENFPSLFLRMVIKK
jgi:hypothetical protein